MSSAWPGGSTWSWRKTRKRVLERDGHRCQLRLDDDCAITADTVHHTVDRTIVGDNPRYLIAACTSCNNRVGDPSNLDPEPRPWP